MPTQKGEYGYLSKPRVHFKGCAHHLSHSLQPAGLTWQQAALEMMAQLPTCFAGLPGLSHRTGC